jgi:hypothetical protein
VLIVRLRMIEDDRFLLTLKVRLGDLQVLPKNTYHHFFEIIHKHDDAFQVHLSKLQNSE